ncbi:MAG TPA: hypothetical protein VFB69_03225 [Candidatus Dormibacteraeota bacterium]|nr:hypothetical protein [Candidatus Dormibacteraeota bacterium]
MTDQRLETEIKEVFDSNHEPSPNLENRVIAALPWHAPVAKRTSSVPRLAGAFAVIVSAALIVVLVGPSILNHFSPAGGTGEPPAYSLGAVTGDYVYIVQRDPSAAALNDQNILLQSADSGRSWVDRLHFSGIYGGMQMLGDTGYLWSLDFGDCTTQQCKQPTQAMTLYRTTDGGVTWAARPVTNFPVEDAFFLDATRGWAVSPNMPPINGFVLFATSNGGTTWVRVGPIPSDSPIGYGYGEGDHPVTFTSDSNGNLHGWYSGATKLFTTLDGGQTWSVVPLPVPAAVSGFTATPTQPTIDDRGGVLPVAYRDPKGADNVTANVIYLYVSTDGGATWGDPRPAPSGFAPVGDIISVTTLDSSRVWLTSQSDSAGDNVQAGPAVAVTMNAGKQWQVFSKTPRILNMIFLDPLRGYAVAVTGVYDTNEIVTTQDGGKTWQVLDVPVFPERKT